MTRFLASFAHDRRGVAAVEMALVAPMLLILMFGAVEAGNFFWNEHIVVKAVRDGARFAGRQSYLAYNCPSGGGAGSINSTGYPNLDTQIKNLTRTGQLTGGTARVRNWTDGQITVTINCVSGATGIYASNSGLAPRVTVDATVPYPSLLGAAGVLPLTLNVRASAQAAVMGV